MKTTLTKIALLALFLVLSFAAQAQIAFGYKGIVQKKISSSLKKGTQLELMSIEEDQFGMYKAHVLSEGKIVLINVSSLKSIRFIPENVDEYWACTALNSGLYTFLTNRGYQYLRRKEMEEEAQEVLAFLADNHQFFEDPYLETYLYSLLYKIYPAQLKDGRPGVVSVKIVRQKEPRATMYPNGTLVLSTGLFSTLSGEDELLAIMATQIAHFVLDHSLTNVNKAIERQNRALFMATLATLGAAAVEGYVAGEDPNYVPGAFTYGTALLSFGLAATVNERFGLGFTPEQQAEADRAAFQLLKLMGRDSTALGNALQNMKEYCLDRKDFVSLRENGDLAGIDTRIQALPKGAEKEDILYDKKISFLTSYNALLEMSAQQFNAAANLVKRNIRAGVASDQDYIRLSKATLLLYDTPEQNELALTYARIAREINTAPTLNQIRQEALALLRLGRNQEADQCLQNYCNLIEKERQAMEGIKNPDLWYYSYTYYAEEFEWAVKMRQKINSF